MAAGDMPADAEPSVKDGMNLLRAGTGRRGFNMSASIPVSSGGGGGGALDDGGGTINYQPSATAIGGKRAIPGAGARTLAKGGGGGLPKRLAIERKRTLLALLQEEIAQDEAQMYGAAG